MPGDAAGAAAVPALFEAAEAHRRAGRLAEAERLYKQILAIEPLHAPSLHQLGLFAQRAGYPDLALRLLEAAATLEPEQAEHGLRLGGVLLAMGRLDDAVEWCQRGLALAPDDPAGLTNLGSARQAQGRFDEAEALFRHVLGAAPGHIEARYNLGNVLLALGSYDEALACFEATVASLPGFVDGQINRANALRDLGRLGEAETGLRAVLARFPDHAEAHKNLGHVLLLAGRLEEGWRDYEWRWQAPSFAAQRRAFAQPLWQGEALAGRTLLIHAEQGFGDTIQFSRYLPRIEGRVLFEVQRPLVRLLAGVAGAEQVIAAGDPLPGFDLHCPLLSLPHILGVEPIPAPTALVPDPAEMAAWRNRIAGPDLKIGLAWSGNPGHALDRLRSLALSDLAPLIKAGGGAWHGVQTGLRQADIELAARLPGFHRHDGQIWDFFDTAALIANLDLVISADSAPAHLAASLGKPVWLLLPYAPDWRWQLGREDSPWYPAMRLFRQKEPGRWDEVVARVVAELGKFQPGEGSNTTIL